MRPVGKGFRAIVTIAPIVGVVQPGYAIIISAIQGRLVSTRDAEVINP
jgi:hypothetical protein